MYESMFGAITFFAKKLPGELCGSNGLPLTPNSIAIYGESNILKTISHPNLCEYLDVIRGKHERIIAVSEYYKTSLRSCNLNIAQIKKIAHSILSGLAYLNNRGIIHRALSPDNILFSSDGEVKLFNYGLHHMTNHGSYVSFPIGHPKYMAPEILYNKEEFSLGAKADVWSLGLIMTEIAFGKILWSNLNLPQIIRKILSLVGSSGTILERLANEHNVRDLYDTMDLQLKEFLNMCLKVDAKERPTPEISLKLPYFDEFNVTEILGEDDVGYHIGFLERVSADNFHNHLKLKKSKKTSKTATGNRSVQELRLRSLKEQYFLWQLAGGDAYSELKKQGMIKSKPPILTIPSLILLEGNAFGEKRDFAFLLDLRVVTLPMESLYQRIAQLPFAAFYPLLETENPQTDDCSEEATLPLIIREKDIEYQFHRIILFQRLLLGYPSNRHQILKEAGVDVTPFFRGDIWASILGISGDIQGLYESIDKESPSITDRQIDVDIPRCHQYNELLASGTGHRKLKRVLKAWVISHPQYVYWQGLDSLCAPFLYLNFSNEAQAYACLSAFIPKYLNNVFLKDNSAVIQEYLAKFRHLIAFHDPELACHLDTIKFIPELFAIPWFLTVFSHVFPIHKILYLWDRLLLGDASFPFYVGLAILNQLRDTLLSSGFNECILLFSDLPEVNIEQCVRDSASFYSKSPRSITYRQHDQQPEGADPILDMTPIPLIQLQNEFCPRISAVDLLRLLRDPQSVLLVDIRNVDEYAAISVPNSINLPFNLISLSELQLPINKEGKILEEGRGRIIVVISSGGQNLTEFCKWLVQCGFPYVCSLHKGIQVLGEANVLV